MDIREEIIELENADGQVVKFAFVDTVEHERALYCALESIENADGIEIGDTVFFKVCDNIEELDDDDEKENVIKDEMELVDDEDLLDVLFEKLDEQLSEEE